MTQQPDPNSSSKIPGPSLGAMAGAALVAALGVWLLVGNKSADHGAINPARAASTEFSADQTQAIQDIVKRYLIENPEILYEVQAALETKLAQEEADRTKKLVAEHGKEIYRSPGAPVAGNPDGDITVVEFFDYNCGYCKRGLSDVAELIESDDRVRVVFK